MKRINLIAIIIAVLFISSNPAFSQWYRTGTSVGGGPNLFLTGNIGINALQKGYAGYKDNIYLGSDLYIMPEQKTFLYGKADWKEKMFYRVSFEFFPLIVPDGVYKTTEDMLAFTGDLMYSAYRTPNVNVFAGLGLGIYDDWIRVNTPATGAVSGMSWFFGIKPSIGAGFKVSPSIEIIPEIRMHYLFAGKGYLATNMTYQTAICWRIK